jgi:hypothetical protein
MMKENMNPGNGVQMHLKEGPLVPSGVSKGVGGSDVSFDLWSDSWDPMDVARDGAI